MDVSGDNRILVMGSNSDVVYIYLKNSNTFSSQQNISHYESDVFVTDITSDGQWLLVVERHAKIRIYENINDTFT